jgi:hypothetical protein
MVCKCRTQITIIQPFPEGLGITIEFLFDQTERVQGRLRRFVVVGRRGGFPNAHDPTYVQMNDDNFGVGFHAARDAKRMPGFQFE